MNDVTGMPQNVVVLGGRSEIALAIIERLAQRRTRRVLLGVRDGIARSRGRVVEGVEVVTLEYDARRNDTDAFAREALRQLGVIDLVLVAVGELGTGDLDELDGERARELLETNCSGPGAALVAFSKVLRQQGFGTIVVLSSLAGVRVRPANFLYGAAKCGLDGLAQGLGDVLQGSGVHVMIVRPGYVHTRMTFGEPKAPMATTTEAVAEDVVRGLERQARVVWSPRRLRGVAAIMPLVPRWIWRRLRS